MLGFMFESSNLWGALKATNICASYVLGNYYFFTLLLGILKYPLGVVLFLAFPPASEANTDGILRVDGHNYQSNLTWLVLAAGIFIFTLTQRRPSFGAVDATNMCASYVLGTKFSY